jgi:hypothetical protein
LFDASVWEIFFVNTTARFQLSSSAEKDFPHFALLFELKDVKITESPVSHFSAWRIATRIGTVEILQSP